GEGLGIGVPRGHETTQPWLQEHRAELPAVRERRGNAERKGNAQTAGHDVARLTVIEQGKLSDDGHVAEAIDTRDTVGRLLPARTDADGGVAIEEGGFKTEDVAVDVEPGLPDVVADAAVVVAVDEHAVGRNDKFVLTDLERTTGRGGNQGRPAADTD